MAAGERAEIALARGYSRLPERRHSFAAIFTLSGSTQCLWSAL